MSKKRKRPAKRKKAVRTTKKGKTKADKRSPQKKTSKKTKPTAADFESENSTSSTTKKRALFVKQYSMAGCNISATCQAVNIDRKTYYNWRKADEVFAQACIDAEDELLDLAESQLFKNITDGNVTSLIFFLCNKGRKRGWQTVSRIEQRVVREGADKYRSFSNKDLQAQIQKMCKRLGVNVEKGRVNREPRSARRIRKAKGKRKAH